MEKSIYFNEYYIQQQIYFKYLSTHYCHIFTHIIEHYSLLIAYLGMVVSLPQVTTPIVEYK